MTIKDIVRAVKDRASKSAKHGELTDVQIRAIQSDVDSKLKKDIRFKSVSRASW